jgi:hypothetical protein
MSLYEALTAIDTERLRAVAGNLLAQMLVETSEDNDETRQLARDRQYPALDDLVTTLDTQPILERMSPDARELFASGVCFALVALTYYCEAERDAQALGPFNP